MEIVFQDACWYTATKRALHNVHCAMFVAKSFCACLNFWIFAVTFLNLRINRVCQLDTAEHFIFAAFIIVHFDIMW